MEGVLKSIRGVEPDPVRKAIDTEFLEALGVEVEEQVLLDIYRKLHESLTSWLKSPESTGS